MSSPRHHATRPMAYAHFSQSAGDAEPSAADVWRRWLKCNALSGQPPISISRRSRNFLRFPLSARASSFQAAAWFHTMNASSFQGLSLGDVSLAILAEAPFHDAYQCTIAAAKPAADIEASSPPLIVSRIYHLRAASSMIGRRHHLHQRDGACDAHSRRPSAACSTTD